MPNQKPPQVARRHHYVTAAYLAQFTNTATKKGRLCAVDFSTGKFFRPKPDDVAFEIDFNRIEIDGVPADALETALSHIEGKAIRVIREICNTGKLPDMEPFSYVYNLMTLFAVRNPALREAALAFERHVTQVVLGFMTSSHAMYEQQVSRAKADGFIRPGLHVPYHHFKDFTAREAYTISIPTQRFINNEFRTFDQVLDLAAQRYWSVMTVEDDGPDLITCDRPAPARLGAKDIVFTISPRHALLGASELYAPTEFKIGIRDVALINTDLLEQARHQIYSRTTYVALVKDRQIGIYDMRRMLLAQSAGKDA